MKILQSKHYKPRRIISERHINGDYHLQSQSIDERLNADNHPFEGLIGAMMASINFRGDDIVIKKEFLKDFVQCTDYSTAHYNGQTGIFYAGELCYYHPEYEFFLLLNEDLSNEYDKTIIEAGFYSVIRLGYDNQKADNLAKIREFFDRYLSKYTSQDAKISLLLKEGQDLVFKTHSIKPLSLDLNTMYNDDFLPVHRKIKDELTQSNKGVVLLHGVAGSGKTNYIKWLTAQVPDKNFIFVPNNLIGALAEPQFMSMLIDNKNSVLVLEDCENYIAERVGGGNTSDVVSTILNIADGILSDVLECQFICTFNADLMDIDHALLRRGRLIAEYQFTTLSVEKANQYLASQGKDIVVTEPKTLAEITNIDEVHYQSEKNKGNFGFIS
ncbi:AAA family ATPase [Moraxella sp. FZLJ2107]|uniref:AAA family ATPase n=1 Tax=unclassified Moraxella TaxID=2685852 RepID=UPI0020C8B7A8|nr:MULTISPECIES: AAA family ATPase [unclassified Moraxella]UTO05286.1 AAA family ATPase [Moraxella sp. FZLJ2107]UTO22021.1 AAA family ATPase [Moraxella sp. FZLJ2109]